MMTTDERISYAGCPLCEHAVAKDLRSGDCSKHPLYQPSLSPDIRWKQCAGCGHIYTEGYYTAAACSLIFGKTNPNQMFGHDVEGQRQVSARIIEKVLPYAAGGHWLDVGFGSGSLLFTAREYGYLPVGTDLRTQNVAAMSALGIPAYQVELGELSIAEKCAVVSMADVLEHMPFPKVGLRAAHGLLEDGGVLFVSMPNMESVVWSALDQHAANPYWGELEHYHNFSRSRLYALLRECGFEPLRYGISERYRVCMEVIARKR